MSERCFIQLSGGCADHDSGVWVAEILDTVSRNLPLQFGRIPSPSCHACLASILSFSHNKSQINSPCQKNLFICYGSFGTRDSAFVAWSEPLFSNFHPFVWSDMIVKLIIYSQLKEKKWAWDNEQKMLLPFLCRQVKLLSINKPLVNRVKFLHSYRFHSTCFHMPIKHVPN